MLSKIIISLLMLGTIASANYSTNNNKELNKDIIYFGEKLFQGNFKYSKTALNNPEYIISIGDVISIKVWGQLETEMEVQVDNKGNIFIPKIGMVSLAGVKNKNLLSTIEKVTKKTYNNNVKIYAHINNFQPISVFIAGAVNQPGMYDGSSGSSVLTYIDKAGGINKEQGSYRNILIKRNNKVIKKYDLYDFLIKGEIDTFQFKTGDVIFIENKKNLVFVKGAVKRAYVFEFNVASIPVQLISNYSILNNNVTNFEIIKKSNNNIENKYSYPIKNISNVNIEKGDTIKFTEDYNINDITIKIDGEHSGIHNVVVEKGMTLDVFIKEYIKTTKISAIDNINIFRKSIAKKEKELILSSLSKLEKQVLTRTIINEEDAKMAEKEAELIKDFIDRARKVEPLGKITISSKKTLANIILEDGDRIYIPKKTSTVTVQGEVNMPGTYTFDGDTLDYYIDVCGGFSNDADENNILVIKQNGKVLNAKSSIFKDYMIEKGDSILVLKNNANSNLQLSESITKIIYNIAVSTAVLLAI